ncbi:MAG TPA: ABC transporter ATP-binding protein [Acidimicrobiales bacterium]|nr:ABC transporter ATP-binding protein [Acidimicrobiales bacterium]
MTALLSVDGLTVEFATDGGTVHAVSDVSFDIHAGEVFAIVGESGSGKSVTAMSILQILPSPPAHVRGGAIVWKGQDLLKLEGDELRGIRGAEIAMVFQDPMTSLNPVYTIGQQIVEMIRLHTPDLTKQQARARAVEVLSLVGIPRAEQRCDDYPHQFSGGMRQRAMIAMAISCDPDLLIADEPTTALDVTVQAQVLEVLEQVQKETKSAILLITHDLGVVAGMADEVLVMYGGRQVERGTVDSIFYQPGHPYTLGLLESLPRLDERSSGVRLHPIAGQPPSLVNLPTGCAFHPRCEFAQLPDPCAGTRPELLSVLTSPAHRAACHFADEVATQSPDRLQRRAEPA